MFNCLQVMVEMGTDETDVWTNLHGGSLATDIHALPSAFKDIQDALAQPRVYRVCNLPCWSQHFPETDAGSFQATDDVTQSQDFQDMRRSLTVSLWLDQLSRRNLQRSITFGVLMRMSRRLAIFLHLSVPGTSLFTSSSPRSSPAMAFAASGANSRY